MTGPNPDPEEKARILEEKYFALKSHKKQKIGEMLEVRYYDHFSFTSQERPIYRPVVLTTRGLFSREDNIYMFLITDETDYHEGASFDYKGMAIVKAGIIDIKRFKK